MASSEICWHRRLRTLADRFGLGTRSAIGLSAGLGAQPVGTLGDTAALRHPGGSGSAGRLPSVVAMTRAFRCGTIVPLPPRATGDDDVPMPGFLLLILAATAFVVVLCLALWVIAEATGGPGVDQGESDRRQTPPAAPPRARSH